MITHAIKTPISNLLRLGLVLVFLTGLFGSLPANTASADGAIIYVKADAGGGDNGTSWADAYIDLQSALSAAVSGDQIWVAAGTYYPTTGTDQDATFALQNGVGIYGGFAGTETLLTERNPSVNVTILSGNIDNLLSSSDNSYHVVTGDFTDSTAILDGFTVTAGNSLGDSGSPWGGGMFILEGSPTLSNLIFNANKASYGGGMYNETASPTLTNIIFSNNTADRAGGLYTTVNSNGILTNVTFIDNSVTGRGGGMTTAGSAPTLTNVTFVGNLAENRGGALHNSYSGNPTLINVTFYDNEAFTGGGAIYNEVSTPELINVTISNNKAGNSLGAIYNEESDTVITNTIIYNNIGDEIYNQNSTPDVTYSLVEGGYTGTGNVVGNPNLGPLQNNGGFTKTMALGAGSAAIDAGTNVGCPSTDQRGYSRPQGVKCDIGAYEVDNSPPETVIDSFPPNPDTDSTPTFTFSGSDVGGSGVASFKCQMDEGGYSPCTSPFTSPALSAGEHTFEVYAIDNLLNEDPTPASYTWTVEFTPTQVVSILRANANPTSAASVNFTVTFSAVVTGVGVSDFSLTSTVSGASIASVSGSGNTYTVRVNTGSGNGKIRLNVPLSADMDDPFGNSPANLPYTGGESYSIFKSGTFTDVPITHPYWQDIEILYANGLTAGCVTTPLKYCPDQIMDRAQSAVFMLRGSLGVSYEPPAVVTHIFADNWAPGLWAEKWAEGMYKEGMTAGCTTSGPLKFCPWDLTPREQAVIFGLRLKYGNNYQPPPATGTLFADMTNTSYYATKWAEQAYKDGLIPSCGTSGGKPMFCPQELVTRGLGAYIIVRAKNLSMP